FCFSDARALHSFPTRRSSDLSPSRRPDAAAPLRAEFGARPEKESAAASFLTIRKEKPCRVLPHCQTSKLRNVGEPGTASLFELRSEEHTSELQSRRDLVCRLL